jgi:nicotinic acid mononucleotide adenylyltransferase
MNTFQNLKDIGATIHLSFAGGGSLALTDVCSPAGRSSVIMGANFINDMSLFNKHIGVETWSKYASYESAKALSVASQEIGNNRLKHVGIGIACSLATVNERVGRVNVVNIVATGYDFEIKYTQEFKRIEGMIADRERYEQEDQIRIHLNRIIELIYVSLSGNKDVLLVYSHGGSGYVVKQINQPKIESDSIGVYAGSFNPIHNGHRELKKISETLIGTTAYFEISLLNFEKNRIEIEHVNHRMREIGEHTLISYDKTFVEKYNGLKKNYPHLKQIYFICGIDTWNRISYEDKNFFSTCLDVKFVVFGRNGEWIPQKELDFYWKILFTDDVLKNYNNPISSSQLRKGQK